MVYNIMYITNVQNTSNSYSMFFFHLVHIEILLWFYITNHCHIELEFGNNNFHPHY